jgi:alpha-galactosidase
VSASSNGERTHADLLHVDLLHVAGAAASIALEPRRDSGVPLWRHFGSRLDSGDAATWPLADARALPPNTIDHDLAFPLLPTHGLGWFQQPALLGAREGGGGDWAQHFAVERIDRPHDGALEIVLGDAVAALGVTLRIAVDAATDVFTFSTEIENRGSRAFRVDWLAAACVPLPAEAGEMISFWGRWSLEFQQARERLGTATWRRDSRRGRNGHDTWPTVIAGTTLADDEGPVWGAHVAWSGNVTMLIEPLDDGRRQLQVGEWFAPGELMLGPGARHRTPDALLTFSAAGLNGITANFHRHLRQHVLRWPGGVMAPRPVHLNTWEAVYFDHDLVGLEALADAAAEVGIERFVLDDGWFHRRDDDTTSLGDWWPDARKYPQGLAPLIDHVRARGMQFGLWVEPEMVSPDSELYRAHPDWALALAGRALVTGRHQLVLDLAQPAVVEYLFGKLDTLLRTHAITYLKWDMNRDLATAAGGAVVHARAAYHAHTAALYALLERVRAAHPQVEIESCSSGGGRADAGILRHTQRVWASDCNDALTRVGIQAGLMRVLPPEVVGTHVGPATAHTTGRSHTLAFRCAVALFGHMGVEVDLRRLSDAERAELARWIAHHKKWRDVVHHGVMRQGSHHGLAWMQSRAEDGSAALVALVRRHEEAPRHALPLRVPGLAPQRRFRAHALHVPHVAHSQRSTPVIDALMTGTLELGGAELATIGLPLPMLPPESAIVVGLRAVE